MRLHLRTIFVVLLLAFFCFPAAAQLSGDTFAKAKASGSGQVTFTYAISPGYVYPSSNSGVQGICVDIMEAFVKYVKEKHGVTLKVAWSGKHANDFGGFVKEVQQSSGGVFGLSSTMISAERKKILQFSPPFHSTFPMIVSHKNAPDLTSLSDISKTFASMKAYACKGTAWEKELLTIKKKHFPSLTIDYIKSVNHLAEQLTADPRGFTVLNINYYLVAVRDGYPIKQHLYEKPDRVPVGIIMPLSSDWAPVVAEFMNSGFIDRNNTEYRKIIANHLGTPALKLLD